MVILQRAAEGTKQVPCLLAARSLRLQWKCCRGNGHELTLHAGWWHSRPHFVLKARLKPSRFAQLSVFCPLYFGQRSKESHKRNPREGASSPASQGRWGAAARMGARMRPQRLIYVHMGWRAAGIKAATHIFLKSRWGQRAASRELSEYWCFFWAK